MNTPEIQAKIELQEEDRRARQKIYALSASALFAGLVGGIAYTVGSNTPFTSFQGILNVTLSPVIALGIVGVVFTVWHDNFAK